jgi:DNA (cytosine-5)-methyltransferase 1
VKPRLLDLFCGAGGCTKGYQDAGFYVVGVDIEPQPNYCGDEFVQDDALFWMRHGLRWRRRHNDVRSFDAIHASPPCQTYSSAMRHLADVKPQQIDAIRELLVASGLPWVIENVPGAPLVVDSNLFGDHGVELCGSMFGLRIRRHRLFETNFPVSPPAPCDHSRPAMNPHNSASRKAIGYAPERQWGEEMGVSWMGKDETRQAIPPSYTEHIGSYLLSHIEAETAATRKAA